MNSAAKAVTVAMTRVFQNQVVYGYWPLFSSVSKLSVENEVGMMQLTASSPCLSVGHAAVRVLPPENARLMT